MGKIENVEMYFDDAEIIDVLIDIPKMEEYGNLNILEFMERETPGNDFGTVIVFENIVYTVYKFDIKLHKPEGVGLLLTKSEKKYSLEQIQIWKGFKESGMTFSDRIFYTLENSLLGIFTISKGF